jgi:hypothetical protein
MKNALAWLKKNWKSVLLGIFTLGLGLLAGRAFKKAPQVVNPELVEAGKKQLEAQEKADAKVEEARVVQVTKVEALKQEHATVVAKLTRAQRDEMEAVEHDPKKLNEFLLGVGNDIRGG